MRGTGLRAWALVLAAVLAAPRAIAGDLGSIDEPAPVEVHAFVSQGFMLTKGANYLASKSKQGSFQLSEGGINFTKNVTEKLRAGVQLFAHVLGRTGNYQAKFDWFYLDYRFADWLGVRAGRVKIPFGLYNEIQDIDVARNAVFLPQSVYPLQNREYLLAQSGGEVYGTLKLPSAGSLEYRIYGGTIFLETTSSSASTVQVADLRVPYLVGGRLLWETPLEGLRIGGSIQALRLDTTLLVKSQPVDVRIPALLWVGSIEYAAHDLLLAAEYSRWRVRVDSTNAALFADTETTESERAYAMLNYRIATWLQPGIYYALLFPNTDKRSGRENVQHDLAITFRYDLTPNWVAKLEGHFMSGTASLAPALNDNTPRDALPRNWGLFLVKTTAYF
jgi:hypothetical protein